MKSEISELVRSSPLWERLAVIAGVLGVALITFAIARWIARVLHGKTALGLQGLERLAAPSSLLAAVAAAALVLHSADADRPLFVQAVEVLAIIAGFWLAARTLDVIWATGVKSARLRAVPLAGGALLLSHHLGRVLLFVGFVTVFAVRLGATEQLYLVLTGLGAALVFAARDPIRNAVAFAAMVLDAPFHLGDQVRLVDFRGGEEAVGEVVGISLTGTTLRTRGETLVVVSNVMVSQLRVENLSARDHRRLELTVPIPRQMPTSRLRAACDVIEEDLRESRYVTDAPAPRVWISGFPDGIRLRASFWLRQAADRREAQRDLILVARSRLEANTQ